MNYYLVKWHRTAFEKQRYEAMIPANSAAQVERLMHAVYGDKKFTVTLLEEDET